MSSPGSFRLLATLFALAFIASSTGCGARQRAEQARLNFETARNMHHLARAVHKYQAQHGAWPAELAEVQPFIGQSDHIGDIGEGMSYEALLANPLTGDDPGYEYVPPVDAASYNIVMIYQLRDGVRDESLKKAYADGAVRE